MYKLRFTKKFLKDTDKLKSNRNFKSSDLEKVLLLLKSGEPIPEKYKNHRLHGSLGDTYDLHVQNDFILLYEKDEEIRLIALIRLGSHSELF